MSDTERRWILLTERKERESIVECLGRGRNEYESFQLVCSVDEDGKMKGYS